MTVFKRPGKNDLFATKRGCLQDGRLSNSARGLLTLMLSMPHDWDFYQSQIVSVCKKDGEDAIRSQMKELVMHGYLIKYPRSRIKGGTWGKVEYEIYDEPQIKDILSIENVKKIFSTGFSWEEFKIIYPKRDYPVQVKPAQVKPVVEDNKEQLPSVKKEEEEKQPSSSSPFLKKEDPEMSPFRARFQNKNFQAISMGREERDTLAKRGSSLTEGEWNDVCLRFIQCAEKNQISPIGGYFTTLIKEKAKPVVNTKELLAKEAAEKEQILDQRKERIKSLQNKYQNNRYWSMEQGFFVEIVPEEFPTVFKYKFSSMKNFINVSYEGEGFFEHLAELEKGLADLKPVK